MAETATYQKVYSYSGWARSQDLTPASSCSKVNPSTLDMALSALPPLWLTVSIDLDASFEPVGLYHVAYYRVRLRRCQARAGRLRQVPVIQVRDIDYLEPFIRRKRFPDKTKLRLMPCRHISCGGRFAQSRIVDVISDPVIHPVDEFPCVLSAEKVHCYRNLLLVNSAPVEVRRNMGDMGSRPGGSVRLVDQWLALC